MSDLDDIQNHRARGCQLLEDRRYEDWTNTFSPDGVFERLPTPTQIDQERGEFIRHVGRAEIMKYILGGELKENPELNRIFNLTNTIIEVTGDTAKATSDVVMMSQVGAGPWTSRVGRYTDDLVRQANSSWLIQKRSLWWRQGSRMSDVRPHL